MTPQSTFDMTASNSGCDQAWIDIQDVMDRCMGNLQLANRILGRFRDGLDETLQQLESLASQNDWEQVGKRVHRLKGEAGNVGCRPMVELAARLEDACVRGQQGAASALLTELSRAARQFGCEVAALSETGHVSQTTSRLVVRPEISTS